MLLLRAGGISTQRGGGGGGGSNPVNNTLPSFVQPNGSGGWKPADPVTTNVDVMLDVGVWSGGTAPYAYDFAIYNAADDSVILARTSAGEVDLSGLNGLTIYGRVWCIDAALRETSADTADFGPITAGFAPTVLASINFRNTVPVGGSADDPIPPQTYASGADTYPVTRAGFTFGRSVGSINGNDRTASSDPRLRGFWSHTTSTSRDRVDLPGGYTGPVKIKLASGTTNSASWGRLGLYDGNPDAGGILIAEFLQQYASGEVIDASGAVKALATWVAEGGGVALNYTMVNSSIYLRRAVSTNGGGTTTAHLCHLYVETAP